MKKTIIILSSIILLALALGFGFFSPYNYFTARKDSNRNIIKKICVNEHAMFFNIERKVGQKYGIYAVNISNVYGMKPINYPGILTYNRVMQKAFIKLRGETIYKKYNQELDSICSHVFAR